MGLVDIISTHALREEGDPAFWWPSCCYGYFYPRPPRGGRPFTALVFFAVLVFLPTPSARRATNTSSAYLPLPLFLPTPSVRRATPADPPGL